MWHIILISIFFASNALAIEWDMQNPPDNEIDLNSSNGRRLSIKNIQGHKYLHLQLEAIDGNPFAFLNVNGKRHQILFSNGDRDTDPNAPVIIGDPDYTVCRANDDTATLIVNNGTVRVIDITTLKHYQGATPTISINRNGHTAVNLSAIMGDPASLLSQIGPSERDITINIDRKDKYLAYTGEELANHSYYQNFQVNTRWEDLKNSKMQERGQQFCQWVSRDKSFISNVRYIGGSTYRDDDRTNMFIFSSGFLGGNITRKSEYTKGSYVKTWNGNEYNWNSFSNRYFGSVSCQFKVQSPSISNDCIDTNTGNSEHPITEEYSDQN